MLDQKPLNRILFLDIETTSQKENFSELTERQQEIFFKRFKKDFEPRINTKYLEFLNNKSLKKEVLATEEVTEGGKKKKSTKKVSIQDLTPEEIMKGIKLEVGNELYNIKAPIFPEFGRILCISAGVIWKNEAEDFYNIKIITFSNEDEKILLSDFINHEKLGAILDKKAKESWAFCAHNGKIFDFPFIAKRLIINGFKLPYALDYAHMKPWEQTHIIDTKETWSFGIWDASVSLDSLSDIFGTASSKDDIDGSQVKDIFWKEKDLPRIAIYCEKDVVALATNYLRMKSMSEEVRVFKQPTQNSPEAEV
jgi:hypothetical protein